MSALSMTLASMLFASIVAQHAEQPPNPGRPTVAMPRVNPMPHANPMFGRDVRIFPLKNTEPGGVMETLIPLFKGVSMVASPPTNSIIASGAVEELDAMEGLLKHLDQPAEPAGRKVLGVRAIQLKHRATDDVSKELMSLLAGVPRSMDGRVAADRGRGKIVLRGTDDFLDFAAHVIAELDVPAQMIQFEFAFFSADQKDTSPPDGIPADLEGVAKELARFGRVRLLGRLACNATENREFQLEGLLGDGMMAIVEGSLINAVADGSIQLKVSGRVRLNHPEGGDDAEAKAPPRTSTFSIETTVVTRRGDTVIIGTAPAGWAPGESAIMVLQVKK